MSGRARRFRFGVEMMGPFPELSWPDSARRIESLGFSTLVVPDHFHEGLGPITAMATAAMATTTLKVSPMVFNTDLRHPAVLARELASIDLLSAGRLEVGLGAGYNPADYRRSGIPMDPPSVRVDRLIEHVEVLKALWSDAPTTFDGAHYRIDDLLGTPKPYTLGGPPLLIAGGGKRLLRFAAQRADIIGVNVALPSAPDEASARDGLPASIDAKFERIRADAGERFGDLEFSAWISVCRVTPDATAFDARLSERFDAPLDDVLQSPLVLVGSLGALSERLQERRERWGYSYIVLQQQHIDELAPLVGSLTGT
ncbi:MAG: TIGR03621 family F420-dependent LLM class oxidoreductase [Ilumatobacteraceae bacterium]